MIDFLLDSTDHSTKAMAHWPSAAFPWLSDGFCVEVYKVHGGWFVSSHFDIRGTAGQWNYGRRVDTQADGAPPAVDLYAECVRLMQAQHRGEPLRHPGQMMADAWDATAEAKSLAEAIDVSLSRRLDLVTTDHLWREAKAETERLRKALHDARAAWFAAQDWRDFRDGLHRDVRPANPGQLPLLEVA